MSSNSSVSPSFAATTFINIGAEHYVDNSAFIGIGYTSDCLPTVYAIFILCPFMIIHSIYLEGFAFTSARIVADVCNCGVIIGGVCIYLGKLILEVFE